MSGCQWLSIWSEDNLKYHRGEKVRNNQTLIKLVKWENSFTCICLFIHCISFRLLFESHFGWVFKVVKCISKIIFKGKADSIHYQTWRVKPAIPFAPLIPVVQRGIRGLTPMGFKVKETQPAEVHLTSDRQVIPRGIFLGCPFPLPLSWV